MAEAGRTVVLISGGVCTGKTTELAEMIKDSINSGASSVLVCCASRQAAVSFRERFLRHVHEEGKARLAFSPTGEEPPVGQSPLIISDARSIALAILSEPESIRFTGRNPRQMLGFQESFLLEDLLVGGMKPKSLKQMLRFFYRSWANLADDEEHWLISGEEEDTHIALKATLAFYRAYLEPEISNYARKMLLHDDDVLKKHSFSTVFVDDFQCLSKASQQMLCLLARDRFVVAENPDASIEVQDSFPNAAGGKELLEQYPSAEHIVLPEFRGQSGAERLLGPLLSDESLGNHLPVVLPEVSSLRCPQVVAEMTPVLELDAISHLTSTLVGEGTNPSAITISTPNPIWSREICSRLTTLGMPHSSIEPSTCARGDYRRLDKCGTARAATLLALFADRNDAMAWRCWCGFGDHLANSLAFTEMQEMSKQTGLPLEELIVGKSNAIGMENVRANAEAAIALLVRFAEKTGRDLLESILSTCEVPLTAGAAQEMLRICLTDELGNNDEHCPSAAIMYSRLHAAIANPYSEKPGIIVAPYNATVGLDPAVLVVSGCVNGFIPAHDYFDLTVTSPDRQLRIHSADVARMYSLIGKGEKQLVLSYFTNATLENAVQLKLKIDRVSIREGRRICDISPSSVLDWGAL